MTGYICHPRGWANHPVFGNIKRDPFDRRSAWNWLLEEAAYRPTETMFGGKKVTLKPGQLVSSIRHMGGRWGWTHTKVARFIRALQQCGLTVTATVTDATIITICDYEEIYGGRRVSDTPIDERPLQQRLATVPGSNKKEEERTKVSKEAGSDSETPPEPTEPSKTAQAPLYAFLGKVIRLTGKDLTQWQTTYHGIPDIIAKLRTLDAYYAENLTGTDQKKWFIRCASALDKAHQEALREARGAGPPPPRHDAGDLSDEQLRALRAKRERDNQASAARLAAEIAQSQAIWERDHRHTERGAQ